MFGLHVCDLFSAEKIMYDSTQMQAHMFTFGTV